MGRVLEGAMDAAEGWNTILMETCLGKAEGRASVIISDKVFIIVIVIIIFDLFATASNTNSS